jgi:hypothetical protein
MTSREIDAGWRSTCPAWCPSLLINAPRQGQSRSAGFVFRTQLTISHSAVCFPHLFPLMPVAIVLAQAYLFPPMNAVELGPAILLLTYLLISGPAIASTNVPCKSGSNTTQCRTLVLFGTVILFDSISPMFKMEGLNNSRRQTKWL